MKFCTKMTILIDASVFCAYANSNDVHHKNAKIIIQEIITEKYGSGITTDYIFDETVTVANRRANKETAIRVGKYLLNSEILIAKIDHFIFEKAWELFQNTKELSFTDCTNIAFMQIFGIKKIATFDKGFDNLKNVEVVD